MRACLVCEAEIGEPQPFEHVCAECCRTRPDEAVKAVIAYRASPPIRKATEPTP